MGCGVSIFIIILIIVGSIGWVKNIVLLTKLDFKAPYKAEVIRGIGLFPLVGAVTGYITIQDN